MTTTRQLERLWKNEQFDRLIAGLSAFRTDLTLDLAAELGGSAVGAAALGLVRLTELNMQRSPIAQVWLELLLAKQQGDGGFESIAVAALAARALLMNGEIEAAGKALGYITAMQREDGGFPRTDPKRLPSCAVTTCIVLRMLGTRLLADLDDIRIGDAIEFVQSHAPTLARGISLPSAHSPARQLPAQPSPAMAA